MEQLISKRKKLEAILKNFLDAEHSAVKNIPKLSVNFEDIVLKSKFCFAQKSLHCSGVGAQEIANENADIYLAVYLRNFFELLIFLRLCERDVKFKIALYVFSIERVIDGQISLINALDLESKRLKTADDQEKIDMQKLVNNLKNSGGNLEGAARMLANFAKEPYDTDFGIYNTEAEFFSLGYTAHYIDTKVLPEQRQELTSLGQSSKNFHQRLLETDYFQKNFPGVGEADLLKTLENILSGGELKSWAKKAKFVGLENEYNFVYRLTSDLIHSTSYSIFSKVKLSATEKDLIARLSLECLIHVVKILLPNEYGAYRVQALQNG